LSSDRRLPVCIIDDDPGALSSLRFLLESENYLVASFRNGSELFGADLSPQPGCYLIDVKLPGMDGIAVCERLRKLRPGAPVILITGHPDPGIRVRAEQAGLLLLDKPLSQEGILAALRVAQADEPRLRSFPNP
jgi:FixJ family two-component response regulator